MSLDLINALAVFRSTVYVASRSSRCEGRMDAGMVLVMSCLVAAAGTFVYHRPYPVVIIKPSVGALGAMLLTRVFNTMYALVSNLW